MEIIDKGCMKILKPKFGCVLYNKKNDSYSGIVYLGKYGDINDYEEVEDKTIPRRLREEIEILGEKTTVSEGKIEKQTEINGIQDEMIDINMMALDELFCMFEPFLMSVASATEVNTKEVRNPMVELYVAMIQRGLKTIEEVPIRYRAKVEKLLKELEK